MFGEPEIESGDRVSSTCQKCGERFTRTEGKDDNVSRCKDCYKTYQRLSDEYDLAAGTWHCGNDEFRRAVQELAEQEFGLHTYVEGDKVYFFE